MNVLLLTGSVTVYLWYTNANRDHEFVWNSRVWWSLCVSYIIFACASGQGGIVNWFLSRPCWQPLSRLSFNMYLLHLALIPVRLSSQKLPIYLSDFTLVINSTFASYLIHNFITNSISFYLDARTVFVYVHCLCRRFCTSIDDRNADY